MGERGKNWYTVTGSVGRRYKMKYYVYADTDTEALARILQGDYDDAEVLDIEDFGANEIDLKIISKEDANGKETYND